MGKGKQKPRKQKLTGRAKENAVSLILGVISGLVANLITSLVRKLFS